MEFDKFFVVAVYVPNAGEGLKRLTYRIDEWDKDFQAHLLSLGKPVILAGDLNVAHNEIDIYDTKGKEKVPGYTPQERQSFSNFLEKSGWIDTFRHFYPLKV
jgi:exodeoxyribonuclease III